MGQKFWLILGRTITEDGEDRGKIYSFLLSHEPTEEEAMNLCIEEAIKEEGHDHTNLYWDDLVIEQITARK